MSAPNLNQLLAADTNRLGPHIYSKTINTSVWNKLVPKETWPDGLSDSIQVLTVERNVPANIDAWTDIASNSNSNNCVPATDTVPNGYTTRSYNLQQKALVSNQICVNDTRNTFRTNTQLQMMYDNLTKVVAYTWKRRNMLEYTRISERKVVATHGLPESPSHFPNVVPTSKLTTKILKTFYQDLITDSAELDGGSLGKAEGRPQFILVCSAETSDYLFYEQNVNNAMLWNDKRVPELLAPLGVDRALQGFYHTIDPLPRRWNFTGGQWVEVQPYETVAATNGYKARISAAYRQAAFEDSVIYLPSVMTTMVPGPISSAGAGTSFAPQQYMGNFQWLNIQHATDNPINAYGFYYCLIQTGTKPVHPEFGIVIRHLRCPLDIGETACPAGISPTSSELSALSDSADVTFDV